MMYYKYIVAIIPFFLTLAECNLENPDKICNVLEEKSSSVKPCIFPFVYKDVTYHGCTLKDGDGTPWCSTEVDANTFVHIGGTGQYGNCEDSNCIKSRDALPAYQNSNNIEIDLMNGRLSPSFDNDEEIRSQCKCQSIESCSWSNDVVEAIKGLNQNHGTFKSINRYFKARICDSGKVFCCNDETSPTAPQLKVLNNPSSDATKEFLETDSGKWLPNGENEECGLRLKISNIVGGRVTKLGDFPYMALIGYDTEGDGEIDGYRCGGSLINKWYVLTAAHCIDTENGKPAEIILGEHTVYKDPDCDKCPSNITRYADKIIVHEDYNNPEPYRNDIALIRLNEKVPLNNEDPSKSLAMPVCLPLHEDDPGTSLIDDEKVVVTGWGKIRNSQNTGKQVFSKVLRQIRLPIANNLCTKPPYEIDDSIQICAGGKKGRDSCNADSGGPMVYKEFAADPWYQAGLVSFGNSRCGTKGTAGVYVKVSAFVPWIISKLED